MHKYSNQITIIHFIPIHNRADTVCACSVKWGLGLGGLTRLNNEMLKFFSSSLFFSADTVLCIKSFKARGAAGVGNTRNKCVATLYFSSGAWRCYKIKLQRIKEVPCCTVSLHLDEGHLDHVPREHLWVSLRCSIRYRGRLNVWECMLKGGREVLFLGMIMSVQIWQPTATLQKDSFLINVSSEGRQCIFVTAGGWGGPNKYTML